MPLNGLMETWIHHVYDSAKIFAILRLVSHISISSLFSLIYYHWFILKVIDRFESVNDRCHKSLLRFSTHLSVSIQIMVIFSIPVTGVSGSEPPGASSHPALRSPAMEITSISLYSVRFYKPSLYT